MRGPEAARTKPPKGEGSYTLDRRAKNHGVPVPPAIFCLRGPARRCHPGMRTTLVFTLCLLAGCSEAVSAQDPGDGKGALAPPPGEAGQNPGQAGQNAGQAGPTGTAPRPPTSDGTGGCVNGTSTQISQFGITLAFDKSHACGQYANGDFWVMGPVTIVDITPKDATPTDDVDMHGAMLGPDAPSSFPAHGFDSRVASLPYKRELNIARQLPYAVPANSSVLASTSHEPSDPKRDRSQVEDQMILTVVSSPVPGGSFRPTYFGRDKGVRWNMDQIDYSKLKNLAVVAGAPTIAGAEEMFERSVINLGMKDLYQGEYLMAAKNLPYYGKNYGREMALGAAYAGLALNLNATPAQKEKLAVRFVQNGLDIYGGVALGNYYDPNGGHTNGYKLPMLLAGVLLNDQGILGKFKGADRVSFSEDGSHFYVTQSMINTPRYERNPNKNLAVGATGCETYNNNATYDSCTRTIDAYTSAMLGMPEWGGSGPDTRAGSNWGRIYRNVTGPSLLGSVLVVNLMGIESAWNHAASLDYFNQRAWPAFSTSGEVDGFISAVWVAHRSPVGKAPAGYVTSSPNNWK
jgi:hypothetical protein